MIDHHRLHRSSRRSVVTLAAAGALLLGACDRNPTQPEAAAAEPLLSSGHGIATDLGMRFVVALNERGDVVGSLDGGTAARWTRTGGLEVLPGFGAGSSAAGINNAGVAVGAAQEGSRTFAVRWLRNGTVEKLLPEAGFSRAVAISDGGLIAGSADGQVFRWSPGSGVELLPAPGLFRVIGMNERGDIFGQTARCVVLPGWEECTDVIGATVWTAEGEMVELPGLGGAYDEPYDINEQGWVVGYAERDFFTLSAVVWTLDGQVRELGQPGQNSAAYGVNDDGVVVGAAQGPVGAFRWTEASGMVSLFDDPAVQFSEAWDVNDGGDVAGIAYLGNGTQSAFLWTESGTQLLQPLDGYPSSWATLLNNGRTVAGTSQASAIPGDGRGTLWAHVHP